MSKDSIIPHPPRNHTVVLREDYVKLCEEADDYGRADQFCAAMILSQFEYWLNVKLSNKEQAEFENMIAEKEGLDPAQNEELWVWKKQTDLADELFNMFGRRKIMKSLQWLVEEKEYILRRKNPNYKWDQTYQYVINASRVIEDIINLEDCGYDGDLPQSDRAEDSNVSDDTSQCDTVTHSNVSDDTFKGAKRHIQECQMTQTIPKTTANKTTSKDNSASRAREKDDKSEAGPEPPLAPQLRVRLEDMIDRKLSSSEMEPFKNYEYPQIKAALDIIKNRGTTIASPKYVLKMLKDEINGRNYNKNREDKTYGQNENPDTGPYDIPAEEMEKRGWNQGVEG